jgi:hypothetical protein
MTIRNLTDAERDAFINDLKRESPVLEALQPHVLDDDSGVALRVVVRNRADEPVDPRFPRDTRFFCRLAAKHAHKDFLNLIVNGDTSLESTSRELRLLRKADGLLVGASRQYEATQALVANVVDERHICLSRKSFDGVTTTATCLRCIMVPSDVVGIVFPRGAVRVGIGSVMTLEVEPDNDTEPGVERVMHTIRYKVRLDVDRDLVRVFYATPAPQAT